MRRTSDYSFDLPAESIAQAPADRRDGSRLLRVGEGAELEDYRFPDLVQLLPEDAVLVVNDTRVIRARLRTQKESGGAVELLLIEPTSVACQWRCLARASKPIRQGCVLRIVGTELSCRAASARETDGTIIIEFSGDVFQLLAEHGELPLPPYIERSGGDTDEDRARYQTLFAREQGAVAAPTAGLHFSEEVLQALDARGITRAAITLHVGLGTFAPVRVDTLEDIRLHEERYHIPDETASLIESGRPIVAVGTTVVRALESAATGEKKLRAGSARTSIFIAPGFPFRIVDSLVTNFHLPESTLLMLVCAFAGYQPIMNAYRYAVGAGYRFYSYGDAMLLSRTRGQTC
jgi:S-adenosylmethionine:tRNA ribosyltransferase-isomerase